MAAAKIPIEELVGAHAAAYQSLYEQIDPAGINQIAAMEAATFLKRSALPDAVLREIWELSDPEAKGYLDRYGFFVALKLITLCQRGASPSLSLLTTSDTPPPRLQNTPPAIDWSVKPENRKKYEEMFQQLGPVDGLLPGSKVKPIMLKSNLAVEILGRIWDLSDQDQDGSLDMEEFVVSMHLVSKALLENAPIPMTLPPQLVKKSKSEEAAIIPDLIPSGFDNSTPVDAPLVATSPVQAPPVPTPPVAAIISPMGAEPSPLIAVDPIASTNGDSIMELEREKHIKLFAKLDTDHDGYVNGMDCRQTFIDTGLPQADLAYIWGAVDTAQTGRLDKQQFLSAMSMVEEKLRERNKPTGNKELDSLNEEIRQLQTERRIIQEEVDGVEAECKKRDSEVAAARRELEQLNAMLRQLETQKREANKKLAELGVQKGALEQRLTESRAMLATEQENVAQLRKNFEEEKAKIEESMTKEDPKEMEMAEELKKLQEELDAKKQTMKELNERHEQAMAKLAEEIGFSQDPFAGQDPFANSDAFGAAASADPFSGGDPFASSDAFGSSGGAAPAADPFGGDPFAPSTSPTPALPPKGGKTPPPRPAPPSRPSGPTRAAPAPPLPSSGFSDDPFAPSSTPAQASNTNSNNDAFANFDAFGASAF